MGDNKKNDRPFAVYAVASQLLFIIAVPLLVFVLGGSYLAGKFNLPGIFKAVFVLLGVFFMLGTLISYLLKLSKLYGGEDKIKDDKYSKYKYASKDYDFYDDNIKKKL